MVARTETGAPTTSDRWCSSSNRLGEILGFSAMICTDTLAGTNPALANRLSVSEIKRSPDAPAYSFLSVPKFEPMSPSPAAESSASTTA